MVKAAIMTFTLISKMLPVIFFGGSDILAFLCRFKDIYQLYFVEGAIFLFLYAVLKMVASYILWIE